ncbi:hypothetical protein DE146DRAFT_661374 [Phaeosphaeria sp. MPI-PUGE-AT-0046c]|nr:hypothetical protein DE146DRAFT_661374 [Phaeosphaeria sp. MPI-PUGE-AT-0046c]
MSLLQEPTAATHAHSRLTILPISIPLPRITAVKQPDTLNYFGPVESSIISDAASFIAAHTDASEEPIMQTLRSFVEMSQEDCIGTAEQKACFWVTIRITQPTDYFKVPRWHQDGRMFECDTDMEGVPRSKYALTLLGPATLLLHQNQHIFEAVKYGEEKFFWWRGTGKDVSEEQVDEADEGLRAWLAEQFEKEEKVKVRNGEVIRFSWGNDESPVHSEPDLDVEGGRVFMTVLFGSEAELKRMSVFREAEWGIVDV